MKTYYILFYLFMYHFVVLEAKTCILVHTLDGLRYLIQGYPHFEAVRRLNSPHPGGNALRMATLCTSRFIDEFDF